MGLGGKYRFGPFEVHTGTRELSKSGTKIKLRGQPYLILEVLLGRAGEIVTREEIREKLWPADTFVDFEHGLNTSVKKLRQVLCDSAEQPRYIETVPRLGYRFIAPVEVVAERPEPSADAPIFSGEELGEAVLSAAGLDPQDPRPRQDPGIASETVQQEQVSRSGPWQSLSPRWLLAAGLVALLLGAAYVRLDRGSRTKRLTEKDTIVLADFANSTGDPVFDDTLKAALCISLRQSPFLNVLSDSEVAKTLQLMTHAASTKPRLTPEVARELCQRAGSKAYLAGSIGNLGSEYVLGLKAVNCESGDTLAEEQVTAASKEKVLDALGGTASRLRSKLGESLATVQKFDVPLEQATTPSLEALKALSLGRKASNEKGAAAGLPYDQRAIELDPNFAMAYRAVGIDYTNLSELGRASEYFTKAFQLRGHASEREKLTITADYYSYVTGELDKAAQTFQEEIESYPREDAAYVNLGIVYGAQGQYEKAAEITRQAVRLAPDAVSEYEDLANYALALQRFDETRQVIHEAQARKLDDYLLRNVFYALGFLTSDSAAMAEQQQWLEGKPEFRNVGLALASDTEAYAGHLSKARELTKRAVDSAIRADSKENGAVWQANAALQQAAYGNSAEARLGSVPRASQRGQGYRGLCVTASR